jgi:hypothetical protein
MKHKKLAKGKKSKETYESPEIKKVRVTSFHRMAKTAPGFDTSPWSSV